MPGGDDAGAETPRTLVEKRLLRARLVPAPVPRLQAGDETTAPAGPLLH